MFSMPGALIEYQMGGSSLTYQNQADIWQDFQRRCLSPHYLEPIEQEISDLLTRTTVARFNLKQLLRADPKTRAEVYEKLVPLGIMSADEARVAEGFNPGAVDYASTPPQVPAATPALLPVNRTALTDLRCPRCGRLAGRVSGFGRDQVRALRRHGEGGMNDLTVIRGDTVTLTATLVDPLGAAYDLTDAELTFSVADHFCKTLDDGITVADPPSGEAVIELTATDTDGDGEWPRRAFPYDLQVTLADGSVKTPIRGLFIVIGDVTT